MKLHSRLAALALSSLLTGAVHALPVTYSESVGGDLTNLNPITTFSFAVGDNTVSGTTGVNLSTGVSDFDSFGFTIALGNELVGGTVELTDATGDFRSAFWSFYSGSLNAFQGTLIESLGGDSPGSDSLSSVPFGAGQYNLTESTITTASTGNNFGNYTFTFTVRAVPTSVPEPAPLALVAFALGGIAFSRRKRV